MTPPNVPLGSVPGIESLVAFGVQIFAQLFSLFKHNNVPTSAAAQVTQALQDTPGLTDAHKKVISIQVARAAAAVDEHNAGIGAHK